MGVGLLWQHQLPIGIGLDEGRTKQKMNNNEQVNALLGAGKSVPASEGAEDWKSKYEETQRMLNSAKVEQGRVAKLDAEKKALEKELAQLKSNQAAKKVADLITPEERGDIPSDFVGLAATVATKATDSALTEVNQELATLRQEREAEKAEAQKRMQHEFIQRVQAKYPGFLDSIGEGGDKANAWAAYLVHNQSSVSAAYAACDFDSLVYHVDRFYREVLGVRPPNGGQGDASIPDPVAYRGSSPVLSAVDPNKTYTQEEFDALEKRANSLRAAGDYKGYKALTRELDDILSEHRLK